MNFILADLHIFIKTVYTLVIDTIIKFSLYIHQISHISHIGLDFSLHPIIWTGFLKALTRFTIYV